MVKSVCEFILRSPLVDKGMFFIIIIHKVITLYAVAMHICMYSYIHMLRGLMNTSEVLGDIHSVNTPLMN